MKTIKKYKEAIANAIDNRSNKEVSMALDLINNSNTSEKQKKDDANRRIAELMFEGFEVSEPNGARKLSSQTLHQAMWRTMSRMKPLDYQIHGSNKPEYLEKIVTQGYGSILKKAKLAETLRDKQGVFWNQILYGDGFFLFNANPNKNEIAPLIFRTISSSNLYVDPYATSIRSPGYGRSATEVLVIFSTSWEEACQIYPKLKKDGGPGEIPREINKINRETGQTYEQAFRQDTKTEIAMYFNISKKIFCVFGGEKCTLLKKEKGEDYPFVKDNQPYIPVGQFLAIPQADGFYNRGIGDMLYRISIVSRQLLNMAVGHAEDSVYPITILNAPAGEASKLFNNLQNAYRIRATGKKGFVINEYDSLNPNAGRVDAQSLITNSLVNEYQFIYEQLSREVRRCGINLDDLQFGNNVTASQVIAETENADAFIKQIGEYNASEWQFLLEIGLDLSKKFIAPRNNTPIDSTVKVKITDQGESELSMKMSSFTYGDIVSELKKSNYFVLVNSRSGAYPSGIMEQAQISRIMAVTPPGTAAHYKLMEQLAVVNNRDFSIEDFMPPQAPPQESEQGTPEEALMTETDRLKVSPDAMSNPEPAF